MSASLKDMHGPHDGARAKCEEESSCLFVAGMARRICHPLLPYSISPMLHKQHALPAWPQQSHAPAWCQCAPSRLNSCSLGALRSPCGTQPVTRTFLPSLLPCCMVVDMALWLGLFTVQELTIQMSALPLSGSSTSLKVSYPQADVAEVDGRAGNVIVWSASEAAGGKQPVWASTGAQCAACAKLPDRLSFLPGAHRLFHSSAISSRNISRHTS